MSWWCRSNRDLSSGYFGGSAHSHCNEIIERSYSCVHINMMLRSWCLAWIPVTLNGSWYILVTDKSWRSVSVLKVGEPGLPLRHGWGKEEPPPCVEDGESGQPHLGPDGSRRCAPFVATDKWNIVTFQHVVVMCLEEGSPFSRSCGSPLGLFPIESTGEQARVKFTFKGLKT